MWSGITEQTSNADNRQSEILVRKETLVQMQMQTFVALEHFVQAVFILIVAVTSVERGEGKNRGSQCGGGELEGSIGLEQETPK